MRACPIVQRLIRLGSNAVREEVYGGGSNPARQNLGRKPIRRAPRSARIAMRNVAGAVFALPRARSCEPLSQLYDTPVSSRLPDFGSRLPS